MWVVGGGTYKGAVGDAVADKQSGKATFFLLPLALGCVFPPVSLSPTLSLLLLLLYIFFDMVGIVQGAEGELRGNCGGTNCSVSADIAC